MSPKTLYVTSKCTKNAFNGRSLPGPAGEASSAPPDPLAELKGREGERRGNGKREGEGREGEKERGGPPNI